MFASTIGWYAIQSVDSAWVNEFSRPARSPARGRTESRRVHRHALGDGQAPQPLGAAHRAHEALAVDRLAEEVQRAVALGLARGLHRGRPGHQDDGQLEVALADGAQELQARGAGHHDVADDDVEVGRGQEGERLVAVLRLDHMEALGPEDARRGPAQGRVVVHEQDARARRGGDADAVRDAIAQPRLSTLVSPHRDTRLAEAEASSSFFSLFFSPRRDKSFRAAAVRRVCPSGRRPGVRRDLMSGVPFGPSARRAPGPQFGCALRAVGAACAGTSGQPWPVDTIEWLCQRAGPQGGGLAE